MIRRFLLSLILAPALLAAVPGPAWANDRRLPEVTAGDRILGRADAPVTVIEYGSLSCPACADWQLRHHHAFKTRFIDTGQVRFVFRDMLTDPTQQAATAAAIARCAAPGRYFEVIHTLYLWQSTARNIGPVSDWYDRGIAAGGRPPEETRACVEAPATIRSINAEMEGGIRAGVTRTPTFFVNGRQLEDGEMETLVAAITPLLPKP